MKKLLFAALVAAFTVACSSGNSNVKTATTRGNTAQAKESKYQIIDQEFDNLLAPEADYDTIPAYELQACGDSYLPPGEKLKGAAKPAVKKAAKTKKTSSSSKTNVTTNKKVINNTNIYYLDADDPIPAAATSSSSTKTTTYTYSSEEAAPAY